MQNLDFRKWNTIFCPIYFALTLLWALYMGLLYPQYVIIILMYNVHPYFFLKIWAKKCIVHGKIWYLLIVILSSLIRPDYISLYGNRFHLSEMEVSIPNQNKGSWLHCLNSCDQAKRCWCIHLQHMSSDTTFTSPRIRLYCSRIDVFSNSPS